jgi:tetratricopeptide (TPR) repeat protein
MNKLFYLFIFLSYASFSQDYGNKKVAIELCTAVQSNNFSADMSAENALERILNVIGASKRFVLQPCDNINNALATSFNGIRYILYDRDFMNTLDNGNNWGNLFILAHEVGHHINGHSLDLLLYKSVETKTLSQRRQQELEADEFAGFVLARLGGSLEDANKIITSISKNSDDSFSTHPNRSKRLAAAGNGYKKATGTNKLIYANTSTNKTAEDYFYSGYEEQRRENYYSAIAAYTKSIEIEPNNTSTYYNRALAKRYLKDYYGAIADYTKAIEINPNNADAYPNRALAKRYLKDYYGAIADYTKAIEINPNNADAYLNRGAAKGNLKDDYGAIADYTKAIEINPNNADAYFNRANAKYNLKDHYGAIADYTKAIEFNTSDANAYVGRGNAKMQSEDFNAAIVDFTKAIEINPNDENTYFYIGLSKLVLGDRSSACTNWKKATKLGHKQASEWVAKYCNK